jgi:hypothetical protein
MECYPIFRFYNEQEQVSYVGNIRECLEQEDVLENVIQKFGVDMHHTDPEFKFALVKTTTRFMIFFNDDIYPFDSLRHVIAFGLDSIDLTTHTDIIDIYTIQGPSFLQIRNNIEHWKDSIDDIIVDYDGTEIDDKKLILY